MGCLDLLEWVGEWSGWVGGEERRTDRVHRLVGLHDGVGVDVANGGQVLGVLVRDGLDAGGEEGQGGRGHCRCGESVPHSLSLSLCVWVWVWWVGLG